MMHSVAISPESAEWTAVAEFERRRSHMLRRSRLFTLAGLLVFSALLLLSLEISEFLSGSYGEMPLARIGTFLARMNPHLVSHELLGPTSEQGSIAYWFYDLPVWARALMVSVEMALVSAVLGGAIALCAATLMIKRLMPSALVRHAVRRTFDAMRTFPDFILALLFVQAFGTGPMAGVVALMISTSSSLARPFAEALENADNNGVDCVKAAGGNWFLQIRYGLLPLVAPNLISLTFIMFEANVARSTALGIVGAGGIGSELSKALSYNQFDTYLALVMMIVGVVIVADITSERIRHRLFSDLVHA
jgi:phosphonate transport system permease protein